MKHGGSRPVTRPDDKRLKPEKKKRVTISLHPDLIAKLKGENKNQLIEKLLEQRNNTMFVIIRKNNALWTSEDILVSSKGNWLIEKEQAKQLTKELEAETTTIKTAPDGLHQQLIIVGEKAFEKAKTKTEWNFLNGVLTI